VRGITHPVRVPVTVKFYENGSGRFLGSFPIGRKEFGVSHDSKRNPSEDEVLVQFSIAVTERKS
jgi:polyisoprenoid-binding protein YceI